MKELLTLCNVYKSFGDKKVLEGITLSVYRGETMLATGANGSGKSTLIRMIAGVTTLSSGSRVISGGQANLKIMYVPDRFPKLPMKPEEYLYHMGRIQGISATVLKRRIEELMKAFNMNEEVRKGWIRNCSKGTIQKVAIMQALLTEPELLVLDEPLSGLDCQAQDKLLEVLSQLTGSGVTIVLTCHDKDIRDKFNCRIVGLANRIIVSDSRDDKSFHSLPVEIRFTLNRPMEGLKQIEGIYNLTKSTDGLCSIHTDRRYSDKILINLLDLECSIHSVKALDRE